jgi:hypothetical protein
MLALNKSLWLYTVKKRIIKITLTLQTVNIIIKTNTTVYIVRITTVLTAFNSIVLNSTVLKTSVTLNV